MCGVVDVCESDDTGVYWPVKLEEPHEDVCDPIMDCGCNDEDIDRSLGLGDMFKGVSGVLATSEAWWPP